MGQKESILRHLELHHTITPMEAFRCYGVLSLSSRVNELRKDGVPIGALKNFKVPVRGNKVAYVTQFYLAKKARIPKGGICR